MKFVVCGALKCVLMSNRECKVGPTILNISSNEPLFYPDSVCGKKWSGSCNDINNPYAKLCIPNVVKKMNIKVSNLLLKTNETLYVSWHETLAGVYNDKQRCNSRCDKYSCEYKELIYKGRCDDEFVWNLSIMGMRM